MHTLSTYSKNTVKTECEFYLPRCCMQVVYIVLNYICMYALCTFLCRYYQQIFSIIENKMWLFSSCCMKQFPRNSVIFMHNFFIFRYWSYLEKASYHLPELAELLTQMKPFLSIMHAKAHTWSCHVIWLRKIL